MRFQKITLTFFLLANTPFSMAEERTFNRESPNLNQFQKKEPAFTPEEKLCQKLGLEEFSHIEIKKILEGLISNDKSNSNRLYRILDYYNQCNNLPFYLLPSQYRNLYKRGINNEANHGEIFIEFVFKNFSFTFQNIVDQDLESLFNEERVKAGWTGPWNVIEALIRFGCPSPNRAKNLIQKWMEDFIQEPISLGSTRHSCYDRAQRILDFLEEKQ